VSHLLKEEDIEIASGCAAAHPMQRGGQHVARQCCAVLVIHKPTGIAVRASAERSQFKNAIAKLREVVGAYEKAAADPTISRQCWCGVIIDPNNDCCRAGHLSPERIAEEI
jgi:protein subunit release factor A